MRKLLMTAVALLLLSVPASAITYGFIDSSNTFSNVALNTAVSSS